MTEIVRWWYTCRNETCLMLPLRIMINCMKVGLLVNSDASRGGTLWLWESVAQLGVDSVPPS